MRTGIYKITNTINGKIYIGQSKDIERRFKQHIKSKCSYAINRALKKYGVDNFTFEVLYECPIEEMNKWETFYITIFGSLSPKGYNLNMGGNGTVTSEETKRKMSEQRKGTKTGKDNHMFGKIVSERTKKLLSIHSSGSNNPMFGRTGANNTKSKPIEIDGIQYGGLREAAKTLNIYHSTIQGRLKSDSFPNYKYR